MTTEIKQNDVVKLIMQFAQENGLNRTFETLKEETGVGLNCVNSIELFKMDIIKGKWEIVLSQARHFSLPASKLFSLYELAILELLEMRDNVAAKIIFREGIIGSKLQKELPQRTVDLEYLIKSFSSGQQNISSIFAEKGKENLRRELANSLASELEIAEPNRLISLLQQALKFQASKGDLQPNISLNIFSGSSARLETKETLVNSVEKVIKLPESTRINSLIFSKCGSFFASGSQDGIIEIWDANTFQLKTDLSYQSEKKFMFHKSSITTLDITKDSSILASADKNDTAKVWLIASGKCLKIVREVMGASINVVAFGFDVSHLILAATEIKVFGLKSSRGIKAFSGHKSNVSSILLLENETMASGDNDGEIRIWNYSTQECVHQLKLSTSITELRSTSQNFLLYACGGDFIGVLSKSPVEKLCAHQVSGSSVISTCSSSRCQFLYAADRNGRIFAYHCENGKVEVVAELGCEVLGMEISPKSNYIVVYTMNGQLIVLSN